MKDSDKTGSREKPFKEKRKLVAIMLADIVGYTTMMSKDEKKTLRLLHKSRSTQKSLIQQFNGKWLKDIGDATLSSFESAVEAVNCAVEIQRALKDDNDLKLRIGLHIGDVVFARGDVFGDGVNVVSRIEPLAPPGGIYVSERVYYDIKNQPNTRASSIGKRTLKGVEEKIEIYSIVIEDVAPPQKEISIPTTPTKGTQLSGVKSLVVLPFDDLSPGRENQYLADGMTEELITMLSKNRWLRVIARTSAMQYKGKAMDIREISHELGVSLAVEGSIRLHGNKLRVAAQLIDLSDGSHLWADKFDGGLDDIFSFQEEVARQVNNALRAELGEVTEEVAIKRPSNTKAYEYYLQGKFLLQAPSIENLDRSVLMFQRALKLDPKYAAAYGVLSSAYLWNVDTGLRPDPHWLLEAKKAADKALVLDSKQPDALYTMANLTMKKGLIEDSFNKFSELLRIDPGYGYARFWRGILLYNSSHFDEALRDANELLTSDPFWPMAHWLHSVVQLHQSKFNAAAEELGQMTAEVPSKLAWLALACRYAGDMGKAWETARKLKKLDTEGVLWRCAFAFLYGAEGKIEEALKCVNKKVQAFSWDFFITTYWVASIYAVAGRKDEAFKWLERSIVIGNRNYRWFEIDPNLDKIRSDPRFNKVLGKAQTEAAKLQKHIIKYLL